MATLAFMLPPLPGRRKSLPTPHIKEAISRYSPNKPPFIDDSLPKDLSGYRQIAYRPSAGGLPPSDPPTMLSYAMTVTAEDWPEMAWMYWTVDDEQQKKSLIVKPSDSPPVNGWFGWRQWYQLQTRWSKYFVLYTVDPNFQDIKGVEPQDVPIPSIEFPLRVNTYVPTLITVRPNGLSDQDFNQLGSNDGTGPDLQKPRTMSDALEVLRDAAADLTVVHNFRQIFNEYSPEDPIDIDRAVRWASHYGYQHLAKWFRELKQEPPVSTTRQARANPPLKQEHARRIELEPEL